MTVFKCKMCGASLEIAPNATVVECEHCGTKQTLPRLDDERKANLYDRANHFRRNNDYDKAMGIYEQILNEDKTDAEAYWSLVLCSYGIEYVEDPATHKRVPTVNRVQYASILADENYKAALQYADSFQRAIYEEEAKAIESIQRGILAISQKEEPFDIFICYKETDDAGRRTQDSVLANDLYHQLTQEGYKVFFSRITLEDKLGTAYEPYIFAALNSAKVMVVLGTKPEHFNAVWVKNEWSRYLTLIRDGAKKVLIPAYRDMDPYDLPEEFSHLQALDMSKLGFVQDLVRGIKKIIGNDETENTKEFPVASVRGPGVEPLLERGFMFCEDKEWDSADEYFERVLDQEPRNANAYLGKLMVDCRVSKKSELRDREESFESNKNYNKICKFGSEELIAELRNYIRAIEERKEQARKKKIYNKAIDNMKCVTVEGYRSAINLFQLIPEYRDAEERLKECEKRLEMLEAKLARKAEEKRIREKREAELKAEQERKKAQIKAEKEAEERRIKEAEKKRIAEEQARIEAEKKAEEEKRALIESEKKAEAERLQKEELARKKKRITLGVIIAVVVIAIAVISAVIYMKNKPPELSQMMKDFEDKQSAVVNGLTVYAPEDWEKENDFDGKGTVKFKSKAGDGSEISFKVDDISKGYGEDNLNEDFEKLMESYPFFKASIQKVDADGCKAALKKADQGETGGSTYYNAAYYLLCNNKRVEAWVHYGPIEGNEDLSGDLETIVFSADYKNCE